MILGYHVILSAYGFWLPNDPRGSESSYVGSEILYRAGGPATKVEIRHSVAHVPHNTEARLQTKEFLKYEPVAFDGHQALSIAAGFQRKLRSRKFEIWALSIMPEHIHLVIGPIRMDIDDVMIQLKAGATNRLVKDGRHPFQHLIPADGGPPPSAFAEKGWNVWIESESHLRAAMRYVIDNPLKEGRRLQVWSFVKPPEGMSVVDFHPEAANLKPFV